MKKCVVILCVLFVLLLGCEIEWTEHSSSAGNYAVQMAPGDPEEQVVTVNSEVGELDLHTLQLVTDDYMYMVSYTDYPESAEEMVADSDTFLDGSAQGVVNGVRGELVSELIITLDGYPGRQVTTEFNDGEFVMVARIYLVGYRLYQVVIGTSVKNAFSPTINKFLDSFRLSDA